MVLYSPRVSLALLTSSSTQEPAAWYSRQAKICSCAQLISAFADDSRGRSLQAKKPHEQTGHARDEK